MDVFRKAISFINHRGGFDFLSDELYLKLIYWQKMGKKLNLKIQNALTRSYNG